MIRKEYTDIIKPFVLRFSMGIAFIFAIFSIIRIFSDNDISFFTDIIYFYSLLFQVIIFWISYNFGINFFKYEQIDKAMEFLLSSPLLKSEIIYFKLIPRLTLLSVLLLFNFILLKLSAFPISLGKGYIPDFVNISIITLSIFFSSLFISIYNWGSVKSFVWIFILLPILSISSLLKDLFLNGVYLSEIFPISVLIVTSILGIGFLFAYKNSDLRFNQIYKDRYALISGIPLISAIFLDLFF